MSIFDFSGKITPQHVDSEDGGKALICTFVDKPDEPAGLFVRVQSWDESKEHTDFNKLIGRKVRVTVEILDE